MTHAEALREAALAAEHGAEFNMARIREERWSAEEVRANDDLIRRSRALHDRADEELRVANLEPTDSELRDVDELIAEDDAEMEEAPFRSIGEPLDEDAPAWILGGDDDNDPHGGSNG